MPRYGLGVIVFFQIILPVVSFNAYTVGGPSSDYVIYAVYNSRGARYRTIVKMVFPVQISGRQVYGISIGEPV